MCIRADRVLTPARLFEPGIVEVDRATGLVSAVGAPGPRDEDKGVTVDLGNRIVVPGYVDVHVHGGAGAQVNGDEPEEIARNLQQIAAFHAEHGTTSLLATTVSDTPERLLATIRSIAMATRRTAGIDHNGARIAGAHLEGPFLSAARAGAQSPLHLRAPDGAELERLIDAGEGAVRIVTLAPELPGAHGLLAQARAAGVTVALGHTDADFATAQRAFDAGASHVTHLFNAMAPLHHRQPGVIGAALWREEVTLELIADLEHVHPVLLGLVGRLAAGRVVAVSDAVPAVGLSPGRQLLGDLEVEVSGGRVELATDPAILAGSLLTMDRAVSNLVKAVGMSLQAAVIAATATPARLLSSSGQPAVGEIAVGGKADLVVLDQNLAVQATMVGGVGVHDPGGFFKRAKQQRL
ncbi:MAG: N-acetylglucosamine-6-phosphate deacetylase [Acidimicrobiales bacterium]